MELGELLISSKNDLPFPGAQINIHQPTINEISLIGEENFFAACQFINFDKNQLDEQDKIGLENKSNFDIIMSIMSGKEEMKYKESVSMLLSLLFPTSTIKITHDEIVIFNSEISTRINNLNFEEFKNIINLMFDLKSSNIAGGDYNPADSRAAKIAEKLSKRRSKLEGNKEQGKVAVFSRYISILAVGENKDKNSLYEYTVYQLQDEFKRFQMKEAYDIYLKARMAGASDLDEVENWMNDIHS
jgi:hypothetical protein